MNLYAYGPNPLTWTDPLGLKCAASSLARIKGKSVRAIERMLQRAGFKRTKVSNSAAKNQTWQHSDGSEVRIHPYGNEKTVMKNGKNTPKSGVNAHGHKQNPAGDQLDDLGNISLNPNDTHIGIRNPTNYPEVRNRPHGTGE